MTLDSVLLEQNINPLYSVRIFNLSSVLKASDQSQCEVWAAAALRPPGLLDLGRKLMFSSFWFDHEVK